MQIVFRRDNFPHIATATDFWIANHKKFSLDEGCLNCESSLNHEKGAVTDKRIKVKHTYMSFYGQVMATLTDNGQSSEKVSAV